MHPGGGKLGSLFVQGVSWAPGCPAPALFRLVFALFLYSPGTLRLRAVGGESRIRFRMAGPSGDWRIIHQNQL